MLNKREDDGGMSATKLPLCCLYWFLSSEGQSSNASGVYLQSEQYTKPEVTAKWINSDKEPRQVI